MPWNVLFRVREHLKGSLWFYSVTGAILGPLLVGLAVTSRASGASGTVSTGPPPSAGLFTGPTTL